MSNRWLLKKQFVREKFSFSISKSISFIVFIGFFILSSLFEDPGFVLIEAIFNRAFVISSNCETAPIEIIGQHSDCGLIYQNNNIESFKNAFIKFKNFNKDEIKLKKIKAFKKIKKYTTFQHFKLIKSVLV